MRLLLTAGHDRAAHVLALAELLRRGGNEVAAVLVVSPFSVARVRALARQRGPGFLRAAARRLAGVRPDAAGDDPLRALLAREGITDRSLKGWAARHGVPYHGVASLNEPAAVRAAREARADGVLYGGGGILGRDFLGAVDGRVLNAHSGPLPAIRGMNACEWSLLLGLPPAVTIHVIDAGIDTGGVLESIPLPVEPGDDVDRLRAKCTVLGVQGLLRAVPRLADALPPAPAAGAPHRQCFVMAPVLREVVDRRLARPSGRAA
jgi:hypothetical protein